ncbi:telomere length regulation protein TEL2 homolog [Actinia tenebrosa]|uniref:Telomere length regulation protein TEL2 homolog n=1 Tax=Actinia tenebrosa TaxID=6105 RepID=A0A6P8HWY8_ACTTE|nr:telomere length regulation protein TEL2 homolog [Actinia tenebrosa]
MEDNFSLSIELQCFVHDQQKRVSSATNVEDIQETLAVIHEVFSQGSLPSFSSLDEKKFLKEEFSRKHYVGFADILLREPVINFLPNLDEEHKNKLDSFFLQGPASECFPVLVGAMSQSSKTNNIKTIISLLEKFVEEKRFVDIFVQKSMNLNQVDTDFTLKQRNFSEKQLVTLIVSLPERVANKLRSKMNSIFYPDKYFVKVAEQILEAMENLHSRLASNVKEVSFLFLSEVVGRLCMSGYGKSIVGVLLPSFEKWTMTSPLWSHICQKLIAEIPDHVIEPVIENLLKEAKNPGIVGKLLGDSILTNSRLEFLFTTKFLLLRYYSNVKVLINIIGYLSGCKRRHLLIAALCALFDSWSSNSAITHTPYNQHVYISCCILHITGYLSNDERQTHKHELLKKLLIGVQNHLESPEHKVRRLGMIVAECATAALEPNTERLSFEYEEDDESKLLKDLSKGLKAEVMQKTDGLKSRKTKMFESKVSLEKSQESELADVIKGRVGKENDDDEDDDLKPYNIDEEDTETQRPLRHLRDCMEALLDNNSDNMEKFESALKSLEKIVCALPGDLDEVCVELMKILLHLQDHFSTDNFQEMRFKAMTAITVRCPVPVAKFLTDEFYAANYSIIQRLDILDVLTASAQELSQPVELKQDKPGSKKFLPPGYNNQMNVESIPEWQRVVQERIEKKTKRFTKGPSKEQPKPVANRFSQVAGHFLFPLMTNYDHKQSTLDLLGDDCFVLGRLIYTLGVIIHSARGTPMVCTMGSAMIEFTWALRYHQEPVVRQVLVFALVMVFTSVPINLLFSERGAELFEVHNWLKDLMERDDNADVKRTAIQALMVLEDAFKREVMPQGKS